MWSFTHVLQSTVVVIAVLIVVSAFAGAAALDGRTAGRGVSSNPLLQLFMAAGLMAAGFWFIRNYL